MTNSSKPDLTVDTKGLMCPEPVMMLHKAIRKAEAGTCIQVLATDPSTERDIPKFCLHLGHELVKHDQLAETNQEIFEFWVVKK